MKRSWNWLLWAGFAVALAAAFSYVPVFLWFPITRDFPWANLLLFVAAGCLLGAGLRRAFAQPGRYRGKVSGPILAGISLVLCGLFGFGTYYVARSLPPGSTALPVGRTAPDFQLADAQGRPVTLSQLRQDRRAVLLIFYRGYW
jgi:cytochrome oxidase Cu insertion factor (SCO1/SenC/PrrC family)